MIENRMTIGDYYPPARISDEDRVTCEACGRHHHMDSRGDTYFVTPFGPACRECRILCAGGCGEVVRVKGYCEACLASDPSDWVHLDDFLAMKALAAASDELAGMRIA